MNIENKSAVLGKFVSSLSDFQIIEPGYPYDHMGATITDAMLQAGINYENAVKPRVSKVSKMPEAKTTSGFLALLEKVDPHKFYDWKGKKPSRILQVAKLFANENVQTEQDLRSWLTKEENARKLRVLNGIGDKTLDYFRMLSGIHTSAIDRHLMNFLRLAGISAGNYSEAQNIINATAKQLSIKESVFDHSIWKYMSDGKGASGSRPCT
jgi:hypothetical protein